MNWGVVGHGDEGSFSPCLGARKTRGVLFVSPTANIRVFYRF